MRSELIGKFVILRGRNSGVHAGEIIGLDDNFIKLKYSYRLWRWKSNAANGALHGVATNGLRIKDSKVEKSSEAVYIQMADVCEVLLTSKVAQDSIMEALWS